MALPSVSVATKTANQLINAGTWNVITDLSHTLTYHYARVDVHLMGISNAASSLFLAYRLGGTGGAWVPLELNYQTGGAPVYLRWEASFWLTGTGAPVLIEFGGYRVNQTTIYGNTAVGGVQLSSYSKVTYWHLFPLTVSSDYGLISTAGGELIALHGSFTAGADYYVYLGDAGDSTDPSCYGGVYGRGYACRSIDGLVLECVTPMLGTAGVKLVSVYDSSGIVNHDRPQITAIRRSFSDILYELRSSWPDWYGVGPRDIIIETDE